MMRTAKTLLVAFWVMAAFFQTNAFADHNRHDQTTDRQFKDGHIERDFKRDPAPDGVWRSDRLLAPWFGKTHHVRVDKEGVLADRIIIKAGPKGRLKVSQITVKVIPKYGRHPKKLNFYPYKRIRHGGKISFEFKRPHRVISVKVTVEGWTSSRHKDGFRVILKKKDPGPPPGYIKTGYYYGQCIGGWACPGYRRHNNQNFSIDLEHGVYLKEIKFYAHDRVGFKHRARINIYVDNRLVAENIDIKKTGYNHFVKIDNAFGRYITFESPYDEAVVQNITVFYAEALRGRHEHERRHDHKRRQYKYK